MRLRLLHMESARAPFQAPVRKSATGELRAEVSSCDGDDIALLHDAVDLPESILEEVNAQVVWGSTAINAVLPFKVTN